LARADEKRHEDQASGDIIAILKRIIAENGRAYLHLYAAAIVCLLAVAGATALIPWVMRPLIDDIFYRQDYSLIPYICGGIFLLFFVRGLATYGQSILLARIGNNLVARYQQRIFDHLMRLGIDYFNQNRSGRLAAQVNQNVIGIREMLSMTLKSIAGDAVLLLALVIAMVSLDPLLSVIALLIGPPLILSVNYLMRRLRRVAREAVLINSRLVGAMQESVQGIAVVKAYTMEDQLSAKLMRLITDSEARANRMARVQERVTPISEMLAGLAIAGVIGYAAVRSSTTGEPPGSVIGFITALLLAYEPAKRLARVQVGLEKALVNARMIYEILDLEPRQGDAPGAPDIVIDSGEVVFDDVWFRYDPDVPVLRGVSFTAQAGRTTAIVGSSGAGKTTLVGLLQRFHDVEAGAIRIDGQDIAGVTKRSLRSRIAYVSQHPYLFEGTVRDNIRYGRPGASDAEVEEAARLAHADDFVRQMPAGYDSDIGENGVTLSGGQRQRISIARAILRNAPILLLDEATSALDNESEARVQAALEAVMTGRTTIVIAHRLSTVVGADRIVVMDEGQEVEQGTHEVLMARPGGLYARFHRLHLDKGLRLVEGGARPADAPASAPLAAEGGTGA
jgi:subfamily B ATP-binding cassette protein MsbA